MSSQLRKREQDRGTLRVVKGRETERGGNGGQEMERRSGRWRGERRLKEKMNVSEDAEGSRWGAEAGEAQSRGRRSSESGRA
jgi:hypothetical protein